jgi:hypothetical protein
MTDLMKTLVAGLGYRSMFHLPADECPVDVYRDLKHLPPQSQPIAYRFPYPEQNGSGAGSAVRNVLSKIRRSEPAHSQSDPEMDDVDAAAPRR